MKIFLAALMLLAAPLSAQAEDNVAFQKEKPVTATSAQNRPELVLDTTKGKVVIALRPDLAPQHVARIEELAKSGFYDGVVFHRVIPGFMAQTGDPSGTGTGGSDKPNLKAEFTPTPYVRGTLGMARTNDPNSANSQFFITFGDSSFLNGQYTVFGEVISGMDVVDKINAGEPPRNPDKIVKATIETAAAQ